MINWRNTQVGWRDRSWKPGGRANGAGVRIPFPPPLWLFIWYRGMEQLVARWAHNPKVVGSNPSPATNLVSWCSWLTRLPVTQKIAGSSPVETAIYGFIAQSVEQGTENPCVAGSIPAGATILIKTTKCYMCCSWTTCLALVAQLDRVFGYEPKGQGFESLRAHHITGSGSTW